MNATSLVSDDLWEAIEPLLPKEPPKPKGGRPRLPDRAVLAGIIFVLRTGCPWRLLPKELGCGSGTTCWRRLRDWQAAGVWEKLHTRLLNWLGDEAAIDWSRASVDSLSVRAKRGASKQGRTPSTVASQAPSTTSWWIATVFPWPSASRRPTLTMPPSSCPWSTPSLPSMRHVGSQGGRANVPLSSTPTGPTTLPIFDVPCVPGALRRGLPDVGLTPPSGSGGTAGWWSARSLGCSAFVASASAMSGERMCFRGCCTWPVRWSASAFLNLQPGNKRDATARVAACLTPEAMDVR
jgi:transposase